MVRGEFVRGDGLVLPNNVTRTGTRKILEAAFQGVYTTLYLTLSNGAVYTPEMTRADVLESGAFAPQELLQGGGWPTVGMLNGEVFVESAPRVFSTPFEVTFTRLALITSTECLALSATLPTPFSMVAATPEAQRTFRYRLYLR